MTLQLDYQSIENWETVCYLPNGQQKPFNVAMGLLLMHTGMQSITYANAEQFYTRARLVGECIGAPFTNGDGTPHYITPEDVHNYIGLKSNCTPRTDAWFYKHLRDNLTAELRQAYSNYARAQQDLP